MIPVLVLAGCATSSLPTKSEEPAGLTRADEPATVERTEASVEQPHDAPTPEPTLHLSPEGPAVGWLPDAEAIEHWGRTEKEGEWTVLQAGAIHSATSSHGLTLYVRTEAIGTAPRHLQAPEHRATGHHYTLRLEDGTPFAEFFCDPMEILVEEEDRTRVRVRDPRGRWILQGWVHGTVSKRGDSCGPRVIYKRSSVRIAPDGTEHPPPREIPEDYVRFRPPSPPPRLRGSVWRRRKDAEQERPTCERWRFQRTKDGLVLERRYRETWGSGRAVVREFIPLRGGPLEFDMYCRGFERRWIRRPDPKEGGPGKPGACGAVWRLVVVDADPQKITWLQGVSRGRRVLAYHPDDTGHWFRTEQDCETMPSRNVPPGGNVTP